MGKLCKFLDIGQTILILVKKQDWLLWSTSTFFQKLIVTCIKYCFEILFIWILFQIFLANKEKKTPLEINSSNLNLILKETKDFEPCTKTK